MPSPAVGGGFGGGKAVRACPGGLWLPAFCAGSDSTQAIAAGVAVAGNDAHWSFSAARLLGGSQSWEQALAEQDDVQQEAVILLQTGTALRRVIVDNCVVDNRNYGRDVCGARCSRV